MSREQQMSDARRWLAQAVDDLSAGRILAENGKYAQACFLCQQAGEKAMKGLWYWVGEEPWGHSLVKLIEDLNDESVKTDIAGFKNDAMLLDRLYIPTRYPNGLPDLAPLQAYASRDFDEALRAAQRFIDLVRTRMKA